MILPSLFLISSRTFFKRSSNSPRYFAPATREAISSSQIFLSFKLLGTSPFTIRRASPSTIAVLPTPGSPIRTGLFFVFLDNILVILRISSSLPITGSIFPALTSLMILRPYFSKTFSSCSELFPYIIITPRYKLYSFFSTCQHRVLKSTNFSKKRTYF